MKMRIARASLAPVPAAIRDWHPDAIVSVASPHAAPLQGWGGHHLTLFFQDLEGPRPVPGPTRLSQRRAITLPEPAHFTAFLAFIEGHRQKRILIHCAAGPGSDLSEMCLPDQA